MALFSEGEISFKDQIFELGGDLRVCRSWKGWWRKTWRSFSWRLVEDGSSRLSQFNGLRWGLILEQLFFPPLHPHLGLFWPCLQLRSKSYASLLSMRLGYLLTSVGYQIKSSNLEGFADLIVHQTLRAGDWGHYISGGRSLLWPKLFNDLHWKIGRKRRKFRRVKIPRSNWVTASTSTNSHYFKYLVWY